MEMRRRRCLHFCLAVTRLHLPIYNCRRGQLPGSQHDDILPKPLHNSGLGHNRGCTLGTLPLSIAPPAWEGQHLSSTHEQLKCHVQKHASDDSSARKLTRPGRMPPCC